MLHTLQRSKNLTEWTKRPARTQLNNDSFGMQQFLPLSNYSINFTHFTSTEEHFIFQIIATNFI